MRPCSSIPTMWKNWPSHGHRLSMRTPRPAAAWIRTRAALYLAAGGPGDQCPLPRALHMTPIGMLRPKKILIIRLRHIGDVLLSTPVFALRDAFPAAQLTMLVNRGTEGCWPIIRM